MPRKRGQKSQSELTTPRVSGEQFLIRPPGNATATERKAFIGIVASVHPEHFRMSDADLILQYVRALALAEKQYARAMAGDDKAQSQWCVTMRVSASLASKLRLAPSSRDHMTTTARREAPKGLSASSYMDMVRAAHDDA